MVGVVGVRGRHGLVFCSLHDARVPTLGARAGKLREDDSVGILHQHFALRTSQKSMDEGLAHVGDKSGVMARPARSG